MFATLESAIPEGGDDIVFSRVVHAHNLSTAGVLSLHPSRSSVQYNCDSVCQSSTPGPSMQIEALFGSTASAEQECHAVQQDFLK